MPQALTVAEKELVRIAEHPVTFSRHLLGHDLWWKQEDILNDIYENPRVAVKACHASSKTFTAAEAVLWFVTAYPNGMVITTAPTWKQVEEVLWREIANAAQTGSLRYRGLHSTKLHGGAPDNFAIGISTNQAVRFQGFHADEMLVVIDEAPGVKPDIWEAIEGVRSGGNVRMLCLGNPTTVGGPFYDAFTKHRDIWKLHTISAFDTPNLEGLTIEDLEVMTEEELDHAERLYLCRRRWVLEKYREWGEGHGLWYGRVLGQFPPQSEQALISLTWLENAKQRSETPMEHGEPKRLFNAGIDVAGPGRNETVCLIRKGNHIVDMETWRGIEARGPVVNMLNRYAADLDFVCVDNVGMGFYFAQHLMDKNFNVWGVNVGDPAYDKTQFFNLKAELLWGLRLRFKDGEISGLTDEETIQQLASLQIKRWNEKGQLEMETKKEMSERGLESPDRADALMLSYAADVGRPRIM